MKIKILISTFILLFSINAMQAQEITIPPNRNDGDGVIVDTSESPLNDDENSIYNSVEVQPEFPGA
jgi:hypothetical protein